MRYFRCHLFLSNLMRFHLMLSRASSKKYINSVDTSSIANSQISLTKCPECSYRETVVAPPFRILSIRIDRFSSGVIV